MINNLDELAEMYYKMYQEAQGQGATVFAEMFIEFMKYTRHLEHILNLESS